MSYIQNLYTSRDNNAQGNTFVGQEGRLWWNPDTNAFYYSDGNTVGGLSVGIGDIANANIDNLTVNTIGTDNSSAVEFRTDVYFSQGATIDLGADVLGSMTVTGDLTITGNISPASNVKIGGIVAGPGVVIGNTGILTIDSANLPVSFGNFFANNNILTMVNVDENMILETSGNAEIQLVGNVGFYKTNGGGVPDPADRYFFAKEDGQIFFYISDEDPLEAAIDIVGTTSGNVIPPGITGAMLQVTGQANIPCRIYYDGVNNYVSWVARRYNGNVAAPTQVLSGEDVLRINATAATDAGVGNVAMAQISISSLENQTTTAQGSQITFTVTPVGSAATSRVNVANVTVANGVTATKFTTAGTVAATGNITGGNITTVGLVTATGNVTGGNILTTGLVTATGNVTGGNITTVGLVTATGNVTGGNILTAGLISATGNVTGGNIADSKGDVRSIPVNTKNTGYTLEATDAGKVINMTTGNVTVPAGVFATPFGQAITIYNDQNASNAIVQGSGVTMRLAGTTATGNRTLVHYGLATVVCVAANTFVISGAGLT
jgi:hypothetical protein